MVGAMAAPFAVRNFAHAQANVIKIIVPFPPGGTVDPIARMVQPGLQQRLGATIVIENKPGASGSLGTAQAAKSPPDGSNWLFVFDTHAVNPFLQSLPFDTEKDLEPVLLIGTAPNIVSAHPSRPFKTFDDVVAAAKAKPDTITYASIGNGSLGHLTGVLLSQRAGIKIVHVPYRGGGPAMNDAIAGHVDLLIGSAALVTPQVKAGRLRALMQTGKARIPALPEIPTAIESGFAGFEFMLGGACSRRQAHPRPQSSASVPRWQKPCASRRSTRRYPRTCRSPCGSAAPKRNEHSLSEQMKLWGPVVREHGIKGE